MEKEKVEADEVQTPQNGDIDSFSKNKKGSEQIFYSRYGGGTFVLQQGEGAEGLYSRRKHKDEVFDDFISAPVKVLATVRDTDNVGWGRLIEFKDMDGNVRDHIIHFSDIGRDCESIIKALRDQGLFITTNNGLAKQLVDYIHNVSSPGNRRIRFSTKTGWHGGCFLLQNEYIGPSEEELVYKNSGAKTIRFDQMGTLQTWKTELASACTGNPILAFSVCTAFAAPLLHLLEMENGGFHLVGDSSIGKSTGLLAASSVFGNPKAVTQRWNATINAMEGIAKAYNDLLLPMDEIGQSNANHIGETIYMFGNGSGKGRSNVLGETRQRVQFRTLFLSNGERTLEGHMTEAGKKSMAGQEVRLVNIPADCGEYGIYCDLHGQQNSHTFNELVRESASNNYGTAFPFFIKMVVEKRDVVIKATRNLVERFVEEQAGPNASGQVKRAAQRFGLVAAAGSLATGWGITGWPTSEAYDSAVFCYQKWIEQRGGVERTEESRLVAQVRAFFAAHAESRFTDCMRDDLHPRVTINRVGFKKLNSRNMKIYYVVFPEQFKNEICQGFDPKMAAKILEKYGLLEKGSDGKFQIPCAIPGEKNKKRMYVFPSGVIAEDPEVPCNEGNRVQ